MNLSDPKALVFWTQNVLSVQYAWMTRWSKPRAAPPKTHSVLIEQSARKGLSTKLTLGTPQPIGNAPTVRFVKMMSTSPVHAVTCLIQSVPPLHRAAIPNSRESQRRPLPIGSVSFAPSVCLRNSKYVRALKTRNVAQAQLSPPKP